MSYVSISFVILVAAALIVYYSVPLKIRWTVLLATSLVFYLLAGKRAIIVVLLTASLAYFMGRALEGKPGALAGTGVDSADSNGAGVDSTDSNGAGVPAAKSDNKRSILLWLSYVLIVLPWLIVKLSGITVFRNMLGRGFAVLGISFYTLELVAYLTDIYKGKIAAEKNYFRFMTFALFFPKIMQGPICRYGELGPKLFEGHSFNEMIFTYGFMEVMWGAFLKYVIADKCNLIVNPVFDNFIVYDGLNLILALALFLVVLYTDFLACVMICKGVSSMFGIDLFMNFKRPLLATNFKEFWQRWHISLSKWLSEYIYIPLGGSRKGEARRLVNLLITFAVSGFWHGTCTGFLMWGLLQALFRMGEEIVGKVTFKKTNSIQGAGEIDSYAAGKRKFAARTWLGRLKICFLYGFSLIFFKLPTAQEGFSYIRHMFNFTGLENVKGIGLIRTTMGYKEFAILIAAILLLLIKELVNEAGVNIKEKLIKLPFAVRLVFYVVFIMFIVNFGTYGNGFNAADFIYGGF